MNARGPQIALSLFAVIAIPVLVGQATQPPAEAEKPAPAKAALTVQLDSSETQSSDRAEIHVQAAGKPPRAATLLTGADGLPLVRARARMSPQAIERCRELRVHHADPTLSGEDWCIGLRGIEDGDSVSGVLGGKGTELTLTVNRRAEFCGAPLWVIIGGLLLGALAIVLPKYARRTSRKALLENALEENEAAGEGKKIEGLRDWVQAQRDATGAAKKSDDQLLPIVTELVDRGPIIAANAHALLKTARAASSLPKEHPAVVKADKELKRATLSRSDLINEDGTAATHPARVLAEVLTQLGAEAGRLEQLKQKIDALDDTKKQESIDAFNKAWDEFSKATEADQLSKLKELIEGVEQALAVAAPSGPFKAMASAAALAAPQQMTAALAAPHESVATAPQPKTSTSLGKRVKRMVVPTILTLVAFLFAAAVAVITIKISSYDPKPAFGSSADYLALLMAAIGSGATGALLSILSVWDPLSPAEEG